MSAAAPENRRAQISWAMFDWANQPYFTLITTFIFAPYFTAYVVGDSTLGQEYWGYGQAAAGIVIALIGPVLGAIADAGGPRKPWIFCFQLICVVACALLWFALPGASDVGVFLVLLAVVVASIGAEFSIVFNNAMMPSLTSEARLGRLSGYAWALGYVGGLVTLVIVLGGFSLPDAPLFGLDKAAHEHDRMVGPLTAVWIAVFIIPLFLFTPDAPRTGLDRMTVVRRGLRQIAGTLGRLPRYRNIALYLLARMFYFDGLTAVFAFGGIYAAGIFGWQTTQLGIFGIVLIVVAAIGAGLGGWLDDRIGSKPTILIAVAGLLVATVGVVSITVTPLGDGQARHTVFFVYHYDLLTPVDGPMFATFGERVFLVFGMMIGIFGGPAQAASRTMVARLAPPRMIGEFYGLYALSGKATAFMAPLTVGIVTGLADSQRIGIATIVIFLAVGGLMMLAVREEPSAVAD